MDKTCIRLIFCALATLFVKSNVITEGTPYQGSILPYETQVVQFQSEAGLKRLFYFQCTGSADLTVLDDNSTEKVTFADFVSKDSSACDQTYACFADPCSVTTCPASPDATCVSNYCDGCIAEFRVNNNLVDCSEPGNAADMALSKGAPPHMAVLDLSESLYSFNLLGKRSNIDSVNSFQLYVFENSWSSERHVMLGEESEVQVRVVDTSAELSWTTPVYNAEIVKHYCIYYYEDELNSNLGGDWLACGLEIKEDASPVKCVNGTSTTFDDMSWNRSHYIWVVAVSTQDIPTSYPFIRIDLDLALVSRTLVVQYSLLLLVLALLGH